MLLLTNVLQYLYVNNYVCHVCVWDSCNVRITHCNGWIPWGLCGPTISVLRMGLPLVPTNVGAHEIHYRTKRVQELVFFFSNSYFRKQSDPTHIFTNQISGLIIREAICCQTQKLKPSENFRLLYFWSDSSIGI